MRYFILISFIFYFTKGYAHTKVENQLFAGIEVGSRGVRCAILLVANNQKSADSYKILKDSAITTNIINFNEKSKEETLNAVVTFYTFAINKYAILKSNIFIGVSSGVYVASKKEAKLLYLDSIFNNFKQKVNNDKPNWQVLSVDEESENIYISMIPSLAKKESLLFDFGSSNVKGGFYNVNSFGDDEFVPLNVGWGASSILKQIQKNATNSNTMANFYKMLDSLVKQAITSEIHAMFTSRAGFSEKRNVIFAGGISWAINNFLMPDQSKFDFLKLNKNDLDKLRILLKDNYNNTLIDPTIFTQNILEADKKEVALTKIKSILKIYDIKALICGVEFLYAFTQELNLHQPNANVGVTQQGASGWLPGYIQQNIQAK